MGFYCKGCVWERVWRLKLLLKTKWISWEDSREAIPRSKLRVEHMTRMRRVMTVWFSRVSHRWDLPAKYLRNILFFYFVICASPCLHPHYIYPNYPHIVRSAFQRENSNLHAWELEIIIPIIIYTFPCGFPLLLHLHL